MLPMLLVAPMWGDVAPERMGRQRFLLCTGKEFAIRRAPKGTQPWIPSSEYSSRPLHRVSPHGGIHAHRLSLSEHTKLIL